MIQIILFCLSLFRLTSAQAGSEDELFASVGVGSASIRGFSWTYDIEHPDLTDPVGKIYWVLTDDGVSMTSDDVRALNNPVNGDTGCGGQTVQEDEAIHQERLDCSLTAGTTYRFWVVVDYDGDGTQQVMVTPGGVPIQPQEDQDCDGFWSSCDVNCIQTYTITQYPTGDGAGCEIGDEEEQTCSPGTDDCPLSGSYDVLNPTTDGFDIAFTPDGSANTAGGMWYWMLTPTGASPTGDEIKSSSGGLCGGSYAITTLDESTQTVDCKPTGPQTYDVWVAEDPNGDGSTPFVLTPLQTVDIPGPLPLAHIFAHTPTDTGYKMSYDVDNPNPAGTFYYLTQPTGSPAPSASDVRSATQPCGGSYTTDDGGAMRTVDVNCPLTPGTDYELWAVVDSDSAGADASFANDGLPFSFTYTGTPTTQAPVTTTALPATTSAVTSTSAQAQTTSAGTTSAPVTTTVAPGPAAANYMLVAMGRYCEEDSAEEMLTGIRDVIQLPNVAVGTTSGTQSDIARCAAQVQANRNANGGCSTLFHTGGPSGICACVRMGYVCDEDESEIGQSIFQVCLGATCPYGGIMMGVIDLKKAHPYEQQLRLEQAQQQQSQNVETESSGSGFQLYGVPVLYYCLAMVLGVLSGVCVFYMACNQRRPKADFNEDFYHIALDTQQE